MGRVVCGIHLHPSARMSVCLLCDAVLLSIVPCPHRCICLLHCARWRQSDMAISGARCRTRSSGWLMNTDDREEAQDPNAAAGSEAAAAPSSCEADAMVLEGSEQWCNRCAPDAGACCRVFLPATTSDSAAATLFFFLFCFLWRLFSSPTALTPLRCASTAVMLRAFQPVLTGALRRAHHAPTHRIAHSMHARCMATKQRVSGRTAALRAAMRATALADRQGEMCIGTGGTVRYDAIR